MLRQLVCCCFKTIALDTCSVFVTSSACAQRSQQKKVPCGSATYCTHHVDRAKQQQGWHTAYRPCKPLSPRNKPVLQWQHHQRRCHATHSPPHRPSGPNC